MNPNLTISPLGAAWTKHSEGRKLTAYPDKGAFSIGYGHRGIPEGTVWTPEQCESAFEVDMDHVQQVVNGIVVVPLTQGQFDALCDFTYNEGAGSLQSSELLKLLNHMKDYAGACSQLYYTDSQGNPHGWIFAKNEYGQLEVNAGLIARRKGEQILWNGGNPLEEGA